MGLLNECSRRHRSEALRRGVRSQLNQSMHARVCADGARHRRHEGLRVVSPGIAQYGREGAEEKKAPELGRKLKKSASRGRDGKGAARCPSCSQNAHDQNVLVRCAQERAASAVPLKRDIGEDLPGCHSDVRTAMMYIRVFNCGPAGVRSPLDGL